MNTKNLLVTKVIDDIAKAPVPDDVKIKALDGIIKLIKNDVYAEKCLFEFDREHKGERELIDELCMWSGTDQGHEFWEKLDHIIYGRD